ncbi:MAG: amidase [Candidatus Rokubacteria bacterium]|nr:amidase [Candidatus Rokubacteria bacterium]
MGRDELAMMSAVELGAGYRARKFSPVEVVDAVLNRIERVNPRLNAFCVVTAAEARREAKAAEAALTRGEALGPLHGVPLSVKDMVITKGIRTTFGSVIYADHVPDEDAPMVEHLKAAGAIVTGKTTTPEFGYKGATHSPLLGVSRNPWNLGRTPGGSSGGAAAAAAAGCGPLHTGGDGGGSIRIPGSFCGVYGLKPSYGLVPAYPASSVGTLAHLGPITWTVRDAALMLQAMARRDDRDPTCLPGPFPDYVAACDAGVRGLRVAWSPTLGYARLDPEVARLTAAAARRFGELGCHVEEVPRVSDDPHSCWYVLFNAGLAARLASYLGEYRDRMSPSLVPLLEEARALTGPDVVRATTDRAAFSEGMRRFFETYDLLLTPTLPVPAFGAEEDAPPGAPSILSWGAFTYPFNLTMQPAATAPCGFTAEGLPVGLQIVGRRLADPVVLAASAAFEAVQPWARKRPPLD